MSNCAIRIHATNVVGLGAATLVSSLLPAFEELSWLDTATFFLPSRGRLASYVPKDSRVVVHRTRRVLPNAFSRVYECLHPGTKFVGEGGLLVLGDIPLRGYAQQVVLLNQSNLLVDHATTSFGSLKYRVAKKIFAMNLKYVRTFVVQSDAMKSALERCFPETEGRIKVLAQPAPEWFRPRVRAQHSISDRGLRLFYPAASYPHKNHKLLMQVPAQESASWPVERIELTIADTENPNSSIPWIRCVGLLDHQACLSAYERADALLFLSLTESYGFPLVEAMTAGLPVVCPDLPYARVLCRDQAVYFDPTDVNSLRSAIWDLHARLKSGWSPDWTECLHGIPKNWHEVAEMLFEIVNEAPL